tara:strand:+ start:649 stop:963 length:315 start_codon:yes stop_codon:yes gene_type:complete
MLRWAVRAIAASKYKNQAIKESEQATRKAKDAMTQFRYAKNERDNVKKMNYMSEGLIHLAEAVSHNSNAIDPIAQMSFVASLLVESIQNNLDEQTKEIVSKIKK